MSNRGKATEERRKEGSRCCEEGNEDRGRVDSLEKEGRSLKGIGKGGQCCEEGK